MSHQENAAVDGGAAVSRFATRRRVEFADTDMGGIVHFSRFFVFMETAEHELLASLGTPVHFHHVITVAPRPAGVAGAGPAAEPAVEREVEVGWPRLAASAEYLSPARYGDDLAIELQVARKGTKAMVYHFTFRCGERLIARGRLAAACCVLSEPGGPRAIAIPSRLADRFAEDPTAAASERATGGYRRAGAAQVDHTHPESERSPSHV